MHVGTWRKFFFGLMLFNFSVGVADTAPIFGAGVEFNYSWQDTVEAVKKRFGSFDFSRFEINVKGETTPFDYSAAYTWYSYQNTLLHAWLGYNFNNNTRLQAGVTDVPFGLETYSYNNWWGDMLFFTGFNTNQKAGLSLQNSIDSTTKFNLGLFKNDVFSGSNNSYYYNLADNQRDVGQLNLRLTKDVELGNLSKAELGISGQLGMMQRTTSGRVGSTSATALHLKVDIDKIGLQLQTTNYNYNSKDPIDSNVVTLGGYNATHTIPAKGTMYNFNLSYTSSWEYKYFKNLTFYNDYSILTKTRKTIRKSLLNTLGFSFALGNNVFVYNDFIFGKNMPSIGGGGITNIGAALPAGTPHDSQLRYNLNISLYV